MKKPLLYLLIVLFACFYTPCGAQNFQIRWQQSIGGSSQDIATCFVQTPDGGTLLAGNSNSTNADVTGNIGSTDIFIVKQNPAGVILWKKNLGGANLDEVQSIKNTIDHGFILVGFTMSNDSDVTGNHGGYDAWVIKLDSIGTRVWQKCLGGSAWDFGRSVQPTRDGGYIIAGETGSIDGDVTGSHGNNDFWVVKLNSAGALLWQKTLGGSLNEEAYSIIETNDHGYFVAGNSESSDGDITGTNGGYDFWVAKLDSTGHLQWQKTVGGTHDEYAHEAIQTSDGGYLIAGETNSNDGDVSGNHGQRDEWLVKLDSTGLLLWQKTFGSSLNDIAMSLTKTADGNLLMAGSSAGRDADVHGNHANEDFWVKKITENGRILWQKCLGGSGVDIAHMIQPTIDGHVIVAGQSTSQNGDLSLNRGNEDFWIVKLSIPRHSITGHVFTDFNLDCTFNTGEKEITHTLLYNQNENTYATVEDSGYTIYTFEADTASITVINLDSMLAISCIMADTLPIYFSPSSSFDTTQINFPISAMISCAKPEILDFSNSIPRRCTWIDQTISYRNSGFDSARALVLVVEIDTMNSDSIFSSEPFVQTADSLIFMLGDIAPFATGIVQFSTHANCSSPLGIAACERAYLTPNNNCYLPIGYDSSDIDIHSHCVGDTIVMTVKNRASRPMNHQGSIIIFEDEIIQRVDSFILYAGESNTFKYLVSTNSTWTAILHQHPAHPTQPILIRENDRCALTVPVKTNIIIPHFPRYDDAASYEENCMIIQGSFDPNLKSVKPVGMFDQHYVAPSQTVSYRIDFQNTGSDTAFGVAVVDTLSPYLDIQSFIAGNASHPYHTEILSNHILKFIFDPIALPDSTNSEINSHGYVQFKIKPITSLPPSTIITNNAAIYFDFNEAVITNAVYNTIYDTVQMFTTIDEVVKNSQPSLIVFPNPAFQQFYLQFDKVIEAATIHIYNSEGKTLLTQSLMQSSGTEIKTSNFKAGIYLISCTTKSGEIWTRKIIIQ